MPWMGLGSIQWALITNFNNISIGKNNMKKSIYTAVLITTTLTIISWPPSAHADSVGNAFAVCQVFRNTGMTSDCKVNSRKIDVRMDTSGPEANKICVGVVNQVSGVMQFDAGWTLRIFSPFSGNHPLAVCQLR